MKIIIKLLLIKFFLLNCVINFTIYFYFLKPLFFYKLNEIILNKIFHIII